MTVMVIVAVSVPPVLVAVIVYEAVEVTAVGVPLIAPVEVSRTNPAGRDGDTAYDTTAPPVEVTVSVVIAVPFSNVSVVEPYVMDGATSLTMMVIVAVSVPPVLVAEIV